MLRQNCLIKINNIKKIMHRAGLKNSARIRHDLCNLQIRTLAEEVHLCYPYLCYITTMEGY